MSQHISILQSPPYSMHRTGSRSVKGNDAFEGYTIDLIKLVAEVLSMWWINVNYLLTNVLCTKRIIIKFILWLKIDVSFNYSIFVEFNYTFKWVDDENYGKRNQETGEWNGMIGELLSQVK